MLLGGGGRRGCLTGEMGGVDDVWRRNGGVNDGWVMLLCGVELRGGSCVVLMIIDVRKWLVIMLGLLWNRVLCLQEC